MVENNSRSDSVVACPSYLIMYEDSEHAQQCLLVRSLDEVVAHTEELRNGGQNESARVFEMRELSLEYKHYCQVEIARDLDVADDLGEADIDENLVIDEGDECEVVAPVGAKGEPDPEALPA